MADETQATQTAEAQQPEPTPSSEQNTSEAPVSEEAVPQGGAPEPTTTEDVSLPDNVKQRTAEQFEKLKQRGTEDRAKIAELENYITQIAQGQQQPKEEKKPLYDPATGIVDVNELEGMRDRSMSAEKRAERAEKKLEQFVVQQQEQEAFNTHPNLNPESKDFDAELHRATRAILTDSIINPRDYGGKELTMKAAADYVSGIKGKTLDEVKETAKQEAMEELTPKEQASLEAEGRSDQAPTDKMPDLQYKSRRGDIDAIVERLKGIPSV